MGKEGGEEGGIFLTSILNPTFSILCCSGGTAVGPADAAEQPRAGGAVEETNAGRSSLPSSGRSEPATVKNSHHNLPASSQD